VIVATILAAIVLSLLLSAVLTAWLKPLSRRVGMLDQPMAHKAHASATPMLGGVAILLAVVLPSLLVLAVASWWASRSVPGWMPGSLAVHVPGAARRGLQALGILLGAGVLHVMGLVDDRRPLGPWVKLLVQLAAAGWVTLACDVRIVTFAGPALSIAATIIWIVVITNAFNFLDNMDGLTAGVGAICAAALLGAALGMGQWFVAGWLCLLLGALVGFLLHNFPPASIFMGDNGSLVVGFLLAVLTALITFVRPSSDRLIYGLLVPLFVMAVPMYDFLSVMIIRIREGRHPMVGDRRHFSHRLVARGMGPRKTALTIYLCTAATAIAATLLPHTTGLTAAILLALQCLAVLMIVALLESA
jgi:UDP-GlcNAc:undecaprenyl-phosphate GlcNAc-1-phosphate transferase